jgi:WD40 repeat protein
VQAPEPKLLEVFKTSTTFVTDVAWSPTHPGVFASVDADGFVFVHSVLRDRVDPTAVLHGSAGATRLRWSADGKTIAVGDIAGNTTLVSLQTDLVQLPSEAHATDISKVFQLNDDLWKAFATSPPKLSP